MVFCKWEGTTDVISSTIQNKEQHSPRENTSIFKNNIIIVLKDDWLWSKKERKYLTDLLRLKRLLDLMGILLWNHCSYQLT